MNKEQGIQNVKGMQHHILHSLFDIQSAPAFAYRSNTIKYEFFCQNCFDREHGYFPVYIEPPLWMIGQLFFPFYHCSSLPIGMYPVLFKKHKPVPNK
jgi:hypothetical protein